MKSHINKLLLQWIDEYQQLLSEKGIITDEIYSIEKDINATCTRIDQHTKTCIGRICAWENGMIDFEILDINSESQLMYAHYEEQETIQYLIEPYIKIMTKNYHSKSII